MGNQRSRICKDCKRETDRSALYDTTGELNPRGRFCRECYEAREREEEQAALDSERAAVQKFCIMYGRWWEHYAYPEAFIFSLYRERETCPYCGARLPKRFTNKSSSPPYLDRPHLDHMDPLAKGGEDSIRNAVYCCGSCNHAKRSRLFLDWLNSLAPQYRKSSRRIYIEKHGHDPEQFVPGEAQHRMGGVGIELDQNDDELRAKYPTPIVSGPPRSYLVELSAVDRPATPSPSSIALP